MIPKNKTEGYGAPAVVRAFALLRIVADAKRPLSLSGLARKLGCGKSTMHGLLKALTATGALNRIGKNYVMGPAIAALTLKDWNILKLKEMTKPVLAKLRDKTEETVFLGAFGISKSTIIATKEALKPLKITAPEGTEIPLQAGAAGKIFLSQMSSDALKNFIQRYGLPKYTTNTITDPKAYREALQKARETGYAIDNEEYLSGVRAVAASIGNSRGLPMAVWFAGFKSAMENGITQDKINHTMEAAETLREMIDKL